MANDKIMEEIDKGTYVFVKANEYEFALKKENSIRLELHVMLRNLDKDDNHPEWTDEDIKKFIQDLKEIADWRKYKELKKKLSD